MKSAAGGAVSLATDDTLAPEAYVLEITPSSVAIRGGTAQGVFYGLQSLRQLVVNGYGVLPVVTVKDRPFFEHRGGMLDSGRYFWTPDQVKEFIDILALHKMNRFHWHLTEDQGWRIEIKKYPELTRIGSVRRETLVGHYAQFDRIRRNTLRGILHAERDSRYREIRRRPLCHGDPRDRTAGTRRGGAGFLSMAGLPGRGL